MRKIFDWIVNYSYMIRGGLGMIFSGNPSKYYFEHATNEKKSIIILSGIFGKWSFLKPITDRLFTAGYPVHIIKELGGNFADIATSAKIVEQFIEKKNLRNVIILGYSKGGLVGKYFLAHHNEKKRVLGMIGIAVPFSGSTLVSVMPHRIFRELLPGSPMLKKLEEEKEINKKIISIMPSYDSQVPPNGSFLEGALDNIIVKARGHHKIIFSQEAKDIIELSVNKFSKL